MLCKRHFWGAFHREKPGAIGCSASVDTGTFASLDGLSTNSPMALKCNSRAGLF
jgi:hypothetical protein